MPKPHSIFRVPGYVADDHVEDVQKSIAKAVDRTCTEEAIAHPSYSGPNTPEQWWALVDEWWAELLSIVERSRARLRGYSSSRRLIEVLGLVLKRGSGL